MEGLSNGSVWQVTSGRASRQSSSPRSVTGDHERMSAATARPWRRGWHYTFPSVQAVRAKLKAPAVAGLLATLAVLLGLLLLRWAGVFETLELLTYDRFVLLRSAQPGV